MNFDFARRFNAAIGDDRSQLPSQGARPSLHLGTPIFFSHRNHARCRDLRPFTLSGREEETRNEPRLESIHLKHDGSADGSSSAPAKSILHTDECGVNRTW
jgi:hypothetical protein